ncbi:MAG: TRAP transporter large permease subunit [Thermodesulfobacteriota bacterium]
MTSALYAGILIAAALLGAPLFSVIAAVALVGFHLAGVDLSVVAIEIFRISDTPLLSALPLFTFAGYVLAESNTSKRIVRLTRAGIGWMPGGLAVVAFIACALFTAITGASGVTIVAIGALLLPALMQDGYREKFSLGLVVSSGSLGLLLPPSLPLILYGVIVQQMQTGQTVEIRDLFLAGILPALLMVAMLSAYGIFAHARRSSAVSAFNLSEVWTAVKDARWELPLPLFLGFGIYGGYFAVSEAAAVTALYVLVVEVFLYREVRLSRLPGLIRESMVMVGSILLILGVALASTNYLVDAQVPMHLFAAIQKHVTDRTTFLILLNLFLIVLGMALDIFSALVLMVPLILPVAESFGIHPVHLGIIFLANMQIGYFTPPVGMNLFIASYRFKKPVVELYRATIPFMLVLLVAVLLITYIPWLSLAFLK